MTDAKFIEEIWRVGVRAKEDEFGIASREEVLFCLKEVMQGERSEEMKRNAENGESWLKEQLMKGEAQTRQLMNLCSS
ncbi:UNVERIFIED_CONTAM: UDP-glycosyltransferase 74C1 [Sesamum radiatum]|uniref:UDP-glycosyltransferase 74C1 n=1 Tax=Sesamum radiatum TaxID=300843 RepID=A0AAW2RZQ7_SESRA